jgi:hypothetical protein
VLELKLDNVKKDQWYFLAVNVQTPETFWSANTEFQAIIFMNGVE